MNLDWSMQIPNFLGLHDIEMFVGAEKPNISVGIASAVSSWL